MLVAIVRADYDLQILNQNLVNHDLSNCFLDCPQYLKPLNLVQSIINSNWTSLIVDLYRT